MQQVIIRMPADERRMLVELAQAHHLSQSAMVRKLVRAEFGRLLRRKSSARLLAEGDNERIAR